MATRGSESLGLPSLPALKLWLALLAPGTALQFRCATLGSLHLRAKSLVVSLHLHLTSSGLRTTSHLSSVPISTVSTSDRPLFFLYSLAALRLASTIVVPLATPGLSSVILCTLSASHFTSIIIVATSASDFSLVVLALLIRFGPSFASIILSVGQLRPGTTAILFHAVLCLH